MTGGSAQGGSVTSHSQGQGQGLGLGQGQGLGLGLGLGQGQGQGQAAGGLAQSSRSGPTISARSSKGGGRGRPQTAPAGGRVVEAKDDPSMFSMYRAFST